jgi:hypothetical protein
VRPARLDRLAAQPPQLLVVVAEPGGRGRVGGETVAQHLLFPLGLRRLVLVQYLQSLLGGYGVGDIAKIHAPHDLLRAHIYEELPERLPFGLGVEVPDGVDDRPGCQMNDTLLWSYPPKLAVAGYATPEGAHVLCERLQGLPDDERSQSFDSGDAQLVAPPDSEREAVTFRIRVGFEDHVGRRVVGVLVHGVGAGEVFRGGEADVAGYDVGNGYGQDGPPR